MGRTLRDTITADVAGVFLNDEEFAETVVVTRTDGPPLTITAVVDESMQIVETDSGLARQERFEVLVSRDETTGIAAPKLGYGIRRAIDPENKGYSFEGEKTEVDENAWTLVFVRYLPIEIGGNRHP